MFRLLRKIESYKYRSRFAINNVTISVQSRRFKSHYTSLGLDSTASPKDIKSAYYELSLRFHPDKNNGSPESVEKFREVAEAYEVLGNPEKKREYDRHVNIGTGYDPDFKRNQYNPRSGFYYGSFSPRTGRSQHFNYEEHFRKHYEEFYHRQKEEHEQFRRRYEADRRYRYEQDFWSRYQPPRQTDKRTFKDLLKSKSFIYMITLWIALLLLSLGNDGDKPRPNKNVFSDERWNNRTVYYKVTKEDPRKDD